VLAPARALAQHGAQMSPGITAFMRILYPILTLTPEAAAIYAPQGRPMAVGERFVSPTLDALFARLERGEDALKVRDLLERFGAPFGQLTEEDLARGRVERRRPLALSFAGREILL